jgi:hypothetical protein
MSEYNDLLLEAYKGEIFGDAFFGALAEVQPDTERREKLRTLQTVEARTARSLERLLANAGLKPGDLSDTRRQGVELAQGIDPERWHEFVQGLHDALPPFLEKFSRLRELAPRPDPALDALVNHERAIERFAELELAGNERTSLKPLEDHLRRPA